MPSISKTTSEAVGTLKALRDNEDVAGVLRDFQTSQGRRADLDKCCTVVLPLTLAYWNTIWTSLIPPGDSQ